MCRLRSGSSILLCWFSHLFLCQYHAVLIVWALWFSLRSSIVMPPVLDLCFNENCFGHLRSFVFPHILHEILFYVSAEYHCNFYNDYIEHVKCFW
jgi:hypothetical protein